MVCAHPYRCHVVVQTYDQFAAKYSNRTGYSNKTGYQEAPYGYDSVWAIASMLNRSQQEMELNGESFSAAFNSVPVGHSSCIQTTCSVPAIFRLSVVAAVDAEVVIGSILSSQ